MSCKGCAQYPNPSIITYDWSLPITTLTDRHFMYYEKSQYAVKNYYVEELGFIFSFIHSSGLSGFQTGNE